MTAFIGTIPQIMMLIFGFSLPGLYFFDIFETWGTIGQWGFFSLKFLVKLYFIAKLVTSGIHYRNQHFMYVWVTLKLAQVLWWLCVWFYVLQLHWDSDRFNHCEFLLGPWFSRFPPLWCLVVSITCQRGKNFFFLNKAMLA